VRAILQRVSRAEVRSSGRVLGRIGRGFVVLLGVARGDTDRDAEFIANRILGLRIFADAAGKMNLAIRQVGGALLLVSQFTLLADVESGRRPSFTDAAAPDDARALYERVLSLLAQGGVNVERGEFGAMMELELVNDGPVTIVVDSRKH
jgi:D-tyrosyl-tRNA(Tyr) deacylase